MEATTIESDLTQLYSTDYAHFVNYVRVKFPTYSSWAEDAVQEGFMRAFRFAHTFLKRNGCTLRSWVLGIIIHQVYTVNRHEQSIINRDKRYKSNLVTSRPPTQDDTVLNRELHTFITELAPGYRSNVIRFMNREEYCKSSLYWGKRVLKARFGLEVQPRRGS